MNEMQTFQNTEFGSVRTMTIDKEPWFVGKDVAEILGHTNPQRAIRDHVDEEDKGVTEMVTPGGKQTIPIINESGLYSLILSSKLPTAKKFKRWVTAEVLPVIRKTGGYVSNEDAFINEYLSFADDQTKMLFKTTLETVRQLNSKIEQDKPKVLFADSVSASKTSILVGELAKILRQNGVDIGQNRLFKWLRENKYLCSHGERYNLPTQKSMDGGLFEIKELTVNQPDGSVRVTRTTKITGKGQQFFISRLIGEKKEA